MVFKTDDAQNKFTVYPNPARTEVFVSLKADKTGNLQVKIVDAWGRIISEQWKEVQKGTNVFPVNTSKLRAGNYVLQILSGAETKTSKLTIIN